MTPDPIADLAAIRLIASASSDLVVVSTVEGLVLFASEGSWLFGWRPEELVGRMAATLYHAEDEPALAANREERMRSAAPGQLRMLCADGSWRAATIRSSVQTTATATFVVVVVRDTQTPGEIEKAIPYAARNGLGELSDGQLILSGEKVGGFNQRFLEMWGLHQRNFQTIDELVQLTAAQVADLTTYNQGVDRFRAGGLVLQPVQLIALKNGRMLERRVLALDGGERLLLLYRDVTDQVRAQRQQKTRAAQSAAVAQLSQRALSEHDQEPFYSEVVALVGVALQADVVGVIEQVPGGRRMRIVAGSGLPQGRLNQIMDEADCELQFAVVAEDRPIAVDDWSAETRFRMPRLRSYGVHCGITVPVRRKGRAVGAMSVHRKRPQPFDGEDVSFLESMANVVASWLDRREADEAVRRSEENYRTLIEAAPDAILAHRDLQLLYCNGTLLKALGYPSFAALPSRDLRLLTHPDDLALVEERRLLAAKGERLPVQEIRMLGRDGGTCTFEFRSLPSTLDGQPVTLAMGRDLTERKAMQLRLLLAERMVSVGTLAAGVAHELNNPLAYVISNLSFLSNELGPLSAALTGHPEEGRLAEAETALREAREGAARLRVIVRDLKTFSRGDDDKSGPVDVIRVLESSLGMAQNEIRHRATLQRDLQPVPPVQGNEARLGQVFLNLLINAAQAIPEGRASENTIQIATGLAPDGRVRVTVRDSGAGIPPEIRSRIFDPFFTTKPVGVGTGLGLSIAHSIVTGMGGTIEVESRPGAGSCFAVLLPAAKVVQPAAAASVSRPAAERSTARRYRVLVVDDEPLVGAAVRRALALEHDVVVLGGAREALELIRRGEQVDAVISDLLMPDCSGVQFHAVLGKEFPELQQRMLFLTGGAFTNDAREFIARPGVRALEKPFDVDVLRRTVRECIAS